FASTIVAKSGSSWPAGSGVCTVAVVAAGVCACAGGCACASVCDCDCDCVGAFASGQDGVEVCWSQPSGSNAAASRENKTFAFMGVSMHEFKQRSGAVAAPLVAETRCTRGSFARTPAAQVPERY